MNLTKQIKQFDIDHVYFTEGIKNTVMDNGEFIRLIYSTPDLTLNGICLLVKIYNLQVDKYYNKLKCSFNVDNNRAIVEQIKRIEKHVLDKYNCDYKTACRNIGQQLERGFIKLYSNSNSSEKKSSCEFMLKISGIWENEEEFGITYKFIEINHL